MSAAIIRDLAGDYDIEAADAQRKADLLRAMANVYEAADRAIELDCPTGTCGNGCPMKSGGKPCIVIRVQELVRQWFVDLSDDLKAGDHEDEARPVKRPEPSPIIEVP